MITEFQASISKVNYLVVALFLIGISLVGFLSRSRDKTTSGFLLGGKNLPWFAVTLSMVMATFSAISFVAAPGEAYTNGLRMWFAGLFGAALIPLGIWMFLRFYYVAGTFTPYQYLEKRFSPAARLTAGLLFIITRGLYLAVVLYASSKAFEGAFGWKACYTIIIMAGLGTFYTAIGGVKSVIWTDVAQFFILFGGILIAAIALTSKVEGGFVGVFSYAFENSRGFNLDSSFFSVDPYERVTFWWMLLSAFGATLGYYATDQLTIQKLLATRNYNDAKRSAYLKVPVSIILTSIFWYVGIALFAYYSQVEPDKAVGLTGDKAFAFFITDKLPTPMPGFIMAALLAATITTVTAGISSLSTVVIKDVYLRFVDKEITDEKQMRLSRVLIVASSFFMIVAALCINWISEKAGSTVLEAVGIWQSLNGMVLGMFILGVTSRRVNNKLVLISTVIATFLLVLAVSILYYGAPPSNRMSFIIVGNVGFLATLVIGYVGSLFYKRLPEESIKGLTLFTLKQNS